MTVLVDSNVILDLFSQDPRWWSWSSAALEEAAGDDRLVINPIVYGEISFRFEAIEDLEDALPPIIEREDVPYEAAFLAAKAFVAYRRRAGTAGRTSLLPDFYIGAHAAIRGYRLLTRDVARYRTYFPKITLIAPEN
ncbi:MAG TPA: type II toxin-antitoxin system VapC family toxin [Reyranella sp.]|jgi:predicted nucleic acid-binding protein|nr:type II toxin-antitoxin system VapC family toxin [Reyranella sp.]